MSSDELAAILFSVAVLMIPVGCIAFFHGINVAKQRVTIFLNGKERISLAELLIAMDSDPVKK